MLLAALVLVTSQTIQNPPVIWWRHCYYAVTLAQLH